MGEIDKGYLKAIHHFLKHRGDELSNSDSLVRMIADFIDLPEVYNSLSDVDLARLKKCFCEWSDSLALSILEGERLLKYSASEEGQIERSDPQRSKDINHPEAGTW